MTTEELITTQFYDWEKRGRGWQLWNCPVELEPPFQPFSGYYLPATDDGRKPNALSSWAEKLHGKRSLPKPQSDPVALLNAYDHIEPALFFDESPLTEIQISLPAKTSASRELAERFLSSLRTSYYPVSFEVIGLADATAVQFACREKDLSLLLSNLRAFFPDSRFRETSGFLAGNWPQRADAENGSVIVDFGLSHEFVIPLQTAGSFSIDTLIGIVAALVDVRDGEAAMLQVLFHATRYDWANSAIWATTDVAGNSVFANAPHMAGQLKQKLSHPLFAAVFRVGATSGDRQRSWELAKRLGAALVSAFSGSGGADANELIPLSNDGYDEFQHEQDLLLRHTHRSGMILNAAELLSLVHLPSASIRSEKFKTLQQATKAAPPIAVQRATENAATVTLGENIHDGEARPVSLSSEQRSRHIHVIGSTGSGKSTLLLNLIKQDMELGNGLCVIDPHGDLIDEVVANVPESRTNDVVLFDPSDSEFPIGFNILQANSELEKTILSSDLVATFRRMSTSWGDVMDTVLANAILAFAESSRGGTLFELKRFLVEKSFRDEFLKSVTDDSVRYFWQHEFPLIASKPQASILIRLDAFMRQKLIRNIVCQRETRLDFRQIMDTRKVLLVKLSQGAIGEENAYLLGTLLVSKIYQTALSRQETQSRPHFWLYLDEFQHFITPSMESVLSGARKYNLGLVLAHQEFRQLQSRNQEVASSVLSNCHTRICFRLGDADAEKFAGGFSFFDGKALQNLSVGEAIARVEKAEFDFNLSVKPVPEIDTAVANRKRSEIIGSTRQKYAASRQEIEATLLAARVGDSADKRSEEIAAKASTRTKQKQADTADGASQHRYLQSIIKRIGEGKGFVATIEREVFGGVGKVDVVLENEQLKIACEIAVTNTIEYELQNIQKCLNTGFDKVAVISPDAKHLLKIRRGAENGLTHEQASRVHFLEPESFHLFLESLASSESKDIVQQKVKGYQVTTGFKQSSESDTRAKKQTILDVIKNAIRRKGKPKND